MKKIFGFVGLVFTFLLFAGAVRANEGVYKLGSVGESGASCYILSVFEGRGYGINGTCRNLTTPYDPEINRYVAWVIQDDGDVYRVGEVKYGKIGGSFSDKFVAMMVTAESGSSPRRPGEVVVARGEWEAVPLIGEESRTIGNDLEVGRFSSDGDEPVSNVEQKGGNSITRLFSAVLRIVGIGFLILLVGVVVMTLLTRRKDRV